MLLANIGVLTASSFAVALGHLRKSVFGYVITIFLGGIFLLNQVEELFSVLAISGPEELGMVLVCFFVHLSHLVLSLMIFGRFLIRITQISEDFWILFVSAYWHLVEVVWIAILATISGV